MRVCACVCVCGAKADLGQIPGLLGFRAIGFRPKEIRISGKQERERERERETLFEFSSRDFRSIDRAFPSKMERFRALAVRIRREAGYNAIQWITKEKRRRRRVGGHTRAVPLSKRGRARHSRKFRFSRATRGLRVWRIKEKKGRGTEIR